jgi:leucyl aminopeptidase
MHERYRRCPGFISHPSREAALISIERSFASPPEEDLTSLYVIDNAETVQAITAGLSAARIEETITALSSFPTRYYNTQGGMDAATWLRDKWRTLPLGRYGATAEYYTHTWLQPSVVLTIPGAKFPDQVVVLGAHLDSTSSGSVAPGADDDASGVATLTEVIRAAMAAAYRPDRTVKIMAYAKEEAGLAGSRAIAAAYRAANVNVVGVLQLDMTNFKGSAHADIGLISDPQWTSGPQNDFLKTLINTYTGLPWVGTQCGYACSDHVGWDEEGYRASFPFEAQFGEHNFAIHKETDTLATSGGNAEHSLKFAKVAAAYLAEMAKGRIGSPPTVPEASAP